MKRRTAWKIALVAGGLAFAGVAGVLLWAAWYYFEDIRRTWLDPGLPYQTYDPPPAPDYGRAGAWALLPATAEPRPGKPAADVFFVHPTTYDGGGDWNAPIDHAGAAERLEEVMLPNYAEPFARVGRVFAPRYRQASLYSFLTLRDDARDARAFAYNDVLQAFRHWRRTWDRGRPLILVGVDQGGALAARLLAEQVEPVPGLRSRLAAVYLIETVVPADEHGMGAATPACASRQQVGCVLAWRSAPADDPAARARILDRALVWGGGGALINLGRRPALCVNPLLGRTGEDLAPSRLNTGAANATGLERGVRPAFLAHQVSARCLGGLLRVSRPESPSLRPSLDWADRRRAPPYNVFWADLEADALRRSAAVSAPAEVDSPAVP